MFCLLLADVSELGGLTEGVDDVAKEKVSLLTFSEGLGTILKTAMWELQSTFFFTWSWAISFKTLFIIEKGGKA